MNDQLIDLSRVYAVLADLAHDVEEGYKDTLRADGHYTSQESLLNSVKTHVVTGDRYYEVTMDLFNYWKYLEYGTKAHWPPREDILNWIRIKPLLPRPDALGRIPSENQLAFLISRAMAGQSPNQARLKNPHGGTQASHGLQRTKDAVITAYRDKIAEALGHDMENYIRKVMPQ